MKRTRLGLIYAVGLSIIGVMLIFIGKIAHDGQEFFETIGISVLVTAVVYAILYYKDFQQDFMELVINILQENNMLADYLTDFVVDGRFVKDRKSRLLRIIKLYEQIHELDVVGTKLQPIKLRGKKAKIYSVYEENAENYIALLDYLVYARNRAVVLNNLSFIEIVKNGRKSINEEANSLFESCRHMSEEYSTLFLDSRKELIELMELEFEHETVAAKNNNRRNTKSKGKMKIRYKRSNYKVSLKNWLFIKFQQSILLIKRLKRNIWRLFKPMLKLFILLTMFWLCWCALTTVAGENIENVAFGNELWNVRHEYFASVILVLFVSAYEKNLEYKRQLQDQFEMYIDLINELNHITEPFFGEEWCYFNTFYCQESKKYTIDFLDMLNVESYKIDLEVYNQTINLIIDKLESVRKKFNDKKIIGQESTDNNILLDSTNELLELMKTDTISNEERKEILIEVIEYLYSIIRKVRCPWIWDTERNKKIIEKLYEDAPEEILEDFYLRMFVYDFDIIFEHEM